MVCSFLFVWASTSNVPPLKAALALGLLQLCI